MHNWQKFILLIICMISTVSCGELLIDDGYIKGVWKNTIIITIDEDGSGSMDATNILPNTMIMNQSHCLSLNYSGNDKPEWHTKFTREWEGTHCKLQVYSEFSNLGMLKEQLHASPDDEYYQDISYEDNIVTLQVKAHGRGKQTPRLPAVQHTLIVRMPKIHSYSGEEVATYNDKQEEVTWVFPLDTGNYNYDINAVGELSDPILVQMRAFIPCSAIRVVIAGAEVGGLYHGDGYSGQTQRAIQIAKVTFNKKEGFKLIDKQVDWGRSSLYRLHECTPTDVDWCWELNSDVTEPWATKKLIATEENNDILFEKLSDTQARLTFILEGGNPVSQFGDTFTPNLSAKISILLRKEDNKDVKYVIEGSHDGFPAYEAKINNNKVYCYDPLVSGSSPIDLQSPKERKVNTGQWQLLTEAKTDIGCFCIKPKKCLFQNGTNKISLLN